jgi:hypothetical protein
MEHNNQKDKGDNSITWRELARSNAEVGNRFCELASKLSQQVKIWKMLAEKKNADVERYFLENQELKELCSNLEKENDELRKKGG